MPHAKLLNDQFAPHAHVLVVCDGALEVVGTFLDRRELHPLLRSRHGMGGNITGVAMGCATHADVAGRDPDHFEVMLKETDVLHHNACRAANPHADSGSEKANSLAFTVDS